MILGEQVGSKYVVSDDVSTILSDMFIFANRLTYYIRRRYRYPLSIFVNFRSGVSSNYYISSPEHKLFKPLNSLAPILIVE